MASLNSRTFEIPFYTNNIRKSSLEGSNEIAILKLKPTCENHVHLPRANRRNIPTSGPTGTTISDRFTKDARREKTRFKLQ